MNEADRAALERIREQTQQAERGGDASFFNDVAADNIVVMPPNLPAVVGRAATVEFMQGFLGAFDLQISYTSEEIQVNGRIAFDRGTYTQTMTPRGGGESIPENGKYFRVYSQNADGAWRSSSNLECEPVEKLHGGLGCRLTNNKTAGTALRLCACGA